MAPGAPVEPEVNIVTSVSRGASAGQSMQSAGSIDACGHRPSGSSPAQPSARSRNAASVSARVSPGSTTCLPACQAPNSAAANSVVDSM